MRLLVVVACLFGILAGLGTAGYAVINGDPWGRVGLCLAVAAVCAGGLTWELREGGAE